MANEAIARPLFEKDVDAITDSLAERLQLAVHAKQWPVLDVTIEHTKPLRLRFTCDSWNDVPPSIQIQNSDGTPQRSLPGGVFHAGPHPATGLPFVCMRGSREYHNHPSHLNDTWEQYRNQDGMNIVGILMQLRDAWRRLGS